MRPLLLLVLVAMLASLGASASAPSKLPPYITFKGNGFEIYTNKHWRIEGVGPAKELEKRDQGSSGSKDRSFRIWARTCKPGQKLTFTRSVDLLGRPSYATASFDSPLAVDYYEIYFGNTKVARNTTTIETKDLRQLRTGLNDIDVVVKLKKTPDACNPFVEPPRRGLFFEFSGSFSTDLRVGKPVKPVVDFDAGEDRVSVTMRIGTFNLGPSVIPGGTLEIRTGGPGWCVKRNPDSTCDRYMFLMLEVPPLTKGDVTCTNDTVYYQFTKCAFEDLSPNRNIVVGVGVRFTPDPASPDWVEEDVTVSWGGRIDQPGPADSNFANNDNRQTIVFCRYGVTDTACQSKPAP